MSAGAAISAAPGTTAAEVAAEGLLIGAPMALTLMAWGKTLGANPPRLAATEIFAATGIAAACCFALWFAPEEIGLALRCVLPFAGVAFMEIARHEQSGATSETMRPTPIKPARARTLSTRMLAGALIFGLAAGFVETYRSDPGSLSTPTLPYAMFIVALFCGGVLETLRASGERDTFSASYRIAFTLMLAGFLFAPVLVDVDITATPLYLQATWACVQLSHRCSARAPSSKEQAARSPSHKGLPCSTAAKHSALSSQTASTLRIR